MKFSIGKNTKQYLASLEEKDPEKPDYHYHQLDAIDKLIYEGGLRIKQVYFDLDLDLMMVLLNNKKIITLPISTYKALANATAEQLNFVENDGFGIHWPDLDQDLSLRGFLQYEFESMPVPGAAGK